MAVLVTRPDERGAQLVEMLNKSGIAAIHLPLFSISAGRELNELPNKINQLNAGDIIFVVSKNAVKFAAETLKSIGFHWRNDVQYIAVGQSTACCLSSLSEQTVIYPFAQENSEGVLNLPQMQQLHEKTVLILRGNGGRELLAEQAKARGAKVDVLECYQRIPVAYDDNIAQVDLCKRSGVESLIVTSLAILQALIEFVPPEEQNWLKACRLVTVSRRIANFAIKCGWKSENILISARADNASLVETLVTTRTSLD
ncbi:uroporphyrinogen-III synthase [Pasteurella langaaensis DSM 22999]|uniref:Uroporphyrinogen-III synthase n=1 Tax=Alitibacter langaaensis DSM 22999 TaxID=1122935 RepID=A0A2U0SM49_9PAST|nr:uroporphyrinogen-III synthase [Pasteurella langaaensis]PVX32410.1 uroporphyrinogen-III synthase [Pasteurella langaaensis DSM 22999]